MLLMSLDVGLSQHDGRFTVIDMSSVGGGTSAPASALLNGCQQGYETLQR